MWLALARVLTIAAAAAGAARSPDSGGQSWQVDRFPSVLAAMEATLRDEQPIVVGIGEWHQTSETEAIESTLHRFNEQVLPSLAPRMSHLIVETWMTSGKCGEVEAKVTQSLEHTIDRPAATESDIERTLKGAHERGAAPRILTLSCDDFRAMRGGTKSAGSGEGETSVDYDRTLRLTAGALQNSVVFALRQRARGLPVAGFVPSSSRPWIFVYGGALHNDVHPLPELQPYVYVPAVSLATLGRYLELDLVVPEYAASSALLRAQPWWPAYLKTTHTKRAPHGCDDSAIRIRRGPRAYAIVFPAAKACQGSR